MRSIITTIILLFAALAALIESSTAFGCYENGRRAWVVDVRGFDPNADPNDYKTSFVYDAAGRVVSTIHPPTEFADSNGAQHTYSHVGFDALGRKLWQCGQTAQEDPNVAADSNESRWFEYDAAGAANSGCFAACC